METRHYDCEYLKDDVERLLKHFKKQQKIHEELERIKPVQRNMLDQSLYE